jgi:hypothetical protein
VTVIFIGEGNRSTQKTTDLPQVTDQNFKEYIICSLYYFSRAAEWNKIGQTEWTKLGLKFQQEGEFWLV